MPHRVRALLLVVATGALVAGLLPGAASATPVFHKAWHGQAIENVVQGIEVDTADNVWLAMGGSSNVLFQIDADGAMQRQIGATGAGDGQFVGPADVALNAANTSLFAVDEGNNRVQKFDATSGAFQGKFGIAGTAVGQFDHPGGITVDPSGNIYVVDTGNQRVQKFDATFVYQNSFNGSGTCDAGQSFSNPRWIASDSSGNVYITDSSNFRVVVCASDGSFVRNIPTPLVSMGGIDVDSSGNVYVSNQSQSEIIKYSSTGTELARFGSFGSGDGQLKNPVGVGIDSGGNIWVADQTNVRMQKFDAAGGFILKSSGDVSGPGAFGDPIGVATDQSGNVFVVDSAMTRMDEFDPTGLWKAGFAAGGLTAPTAASVNNNNSTIYVTDTGNGRVVQYGLGGGLVTDNDGSNQSLELTDPRGIAFDPVTDKVYVVDTTNNRIITFDSALTTATLFKSGSGTGPSQFDAPQGVAVDKAGNVYVTDTGNNRVQEFDSSGTFVRELGTLGSGDGQFSGPTGITIDASNAILVADTGNDRVTRFLQGSTGPVPTQLGGPGTSIGQLEAPTSVAVDPRGIGYVADSGNTRVQRFALSGGLNPLPPKRILDTRVGTGAPAAAIAPNGTIAVDVTDTFGSGVPASGVEAVVLNVTATGSAQGGWLTLFPTGSPLPGASNLNFTAGQTVPNLVVVKVGTGGKVSVNNTGTPVNPQPAAGPVHVIADVVGWFSDGSTLSGTAGASEFVGVDPVRLLDTRFGTGAPQAAIAPNGFVTLDVATPLPNECLGATTAVLNVTATAPTQAGWLTVYPAGTALPNASNLNFLGGQTVPNLVTVKLGEGGANVGKVVIENTDVPGSSHPASGTVQAIADLIGCYTPPTASVGYATTFAPVRILDTRFGTGVPGGSHNPVAANGTITVDPQVASPSIPAVGQYKGVIVNVTATAPTQGGWLTVFPSDGTLPNASNLNFTAGQTVPNLVKIKVGTDGKFKIENTDIPTLPHPSSGTVHVIVDIVGYYQ